MQIDPKIIKKTNIQICTAKCLVNCLDLLIALCRKLNFASSDANFLKKFPKNLMQMASEIIKVFLLKFLKFNINNIILRIFLIENKIIYRLREFWNL
jgi:hypothetical protein